MNFRLWDRIRDWVLLGTLLAVSGLFLLWKNEPMLQGLRAVSLHVAAAAESRLSWIGDYLRAVDENDRLRDTNMVLAGEVARTREAFIENERLRALLALRDSVEAPTRAARVVSKDITRQQNFFTIDAGRAEGVEADMAVVDEWGVVGKVVFAAEHNARVMPYLNTELRIPVKIQPTQAAGIVRWDGLRRDRLVLDHVIKTEPVEVGQRVVTSGYSLVFPAGYPVGIVDSVAVRPGRNDLTIFVRPLARYLNAEYVFVLLALPDPERIDVEAYKLE